MLPGCTGLPAARAGGPRATAEGVPSSVACSVMTVHLQADIGATARSVRTGPHSPQPAAWAGRAQALPCDSGCQKRSAAPHNKRKRLVNSRPAANARALKRLTRHTSSRCGRDLQKPSKGAQQRRRALPVLLKHQRCGTQRTLQSSVVTQRTNPLSSPNH